MKAGDSKRSRPIGLRGLVRVTATGPRRPRTLVVVMSLVAVMGLLVAAPALAGTTNASTLTKSGTDAQTGSAAAATSSVGKTAPGDTINWVLNYRNTTGSPANANIGDPIGANQTFVPGSLKTPPGFSPAWSTNGGGSYTATEPASGVNAIRAAGTSVDGSTGAQSLFSAPLASFNAGASQGDGWEALFVGSNVYNVHHHTFQQNSGGDTVFDCHVAATGAECPGYPGIGQTVPTTAGTPLGTAQPPAQTIVTAFHNNGANYSGRIYFASAIAGTTNIGVSCVDTTNNTSCGYTQLGTSANATPAVASASAQMTGGAQIGSKYYTLGYSNGGPVYCFDMAANAPCAGWSNPSSVPGFTAGPYTAGFTLDSWGGYIFTTQADAAGTNWLGCVVAATGALCPGWATPKTSGGVGNTMAPITNASGAVTGICVSNTTGAGVTATYQCYNIDGTPIAGAAPFASVIPSGDSAGLNITADPLLIGTRLYQPWVNSGGGVGPFGSSVYTCWDYSTSSACQGFTPVASGNAATQAYTIRQDPNAPDCLWELGNGGTFEVFSATFGGSASCSTGSSQVKLTPSDYYCDGHGGHVTGWKQLEVYGVNPAQYDAVAVTIKDANGNPVPGWTNRVISSGQVPIDISSIPYSGSTTSLTVQVVIDWGTHPVVQGTAVGATYAGDPVQVCFQTKVGAASCTADQSISNNGNATTSASNNVSDAPAGDNSGDATFIELPNPTTSGCAADLSISKTPDGTSVRPGGQVMYTLVVQNHGPDTATSTQISDAIPAGLSVVSAQPSQGSCTTAGAVDCSLGTILDGGSAQILVTADVARGASGTITNCATTSAFQTDPNTANNASCAPIHVVPPPLPPVTPVDVQVVKHVNHSVAKAGEVLTYTLDVKNNGPATAPSVGVTDTSAIALRVLSIKPSQGTCTKGVPFSCKLGALAAGKTAKVTIRAIPRQTGAEVNNVSTTPGCANDGSCPPDSNTKNNVSRAKTTVRPALLLVKAVNHHVVRAGEKVTYHLKVTNPTSVALKHVRVCDRLPAGLAYVSAKPKAKLAHGSQCWSYTSLGAHKSQTITLIARTLHSAHGNLTNHATATATGVPTARAKRRVRVIPAPKALRLVKTVNHHVVSAGQKLTYHLKVTNPNSIALKHVRVCDRLPLGLVYLSAQPKAKLANGSQCWTYKSLGAHKSKTITLHARALKGVSGRKTNHATATATGVRKVTAKATVRVRRAPKPPPTPVTG